MSWSVAPRSERPVDSVARLRTTRLCLNRILQEPALVRSITSYYKDVLSSDAWNRMATLMNQLNQAKSASRPQTQRMIQEMAGYFDYYFDQTWIMSMSMVAVARCQWRSPQVKATIVMSFFDVFHRATQAHMAKNVLCFTQFLHGNFDDPDMDSRDTTGPFTAWNVRFFERIFESGAIEMPLHMVENVDTYCHVDFFKEYRNPAHMPRLVAGTIRDVVFVLAVYLTNNPSNRHAETYMSRLMSATQSMHRKIAEIEGEMEESDQSD